MRLPHKMLKPHKMMLPHKMLQPHKMRLPLKFRLPWKMRLPGKMWLLQNLGAFKDGTASQGSLMRSACLKDYCWFIFKAVSHNNTASHDDEAMTVEVAFKMRMFHMSKLPDNMRLPLGIGSCIRFPEKVRLFHKCTRCWPVCIFGL